MLEKQIVIDRIEITRDSHIQIRRADLFIEDGVEVAKNYHRHVLTPGDDTTNEDERVKKVAEAVWTPGVVAKYKAEKKKLLSG